VDKKRDFRDSSIPAGEAAALGGIVYLRCGIRSGGPSLPVAPAPTLVPSPPTVEPTGPGRRSAFCSPLSPPKAPPVDDLGPASDAALDAAGRVTRKRIVLLMQPKASLARARGHGTADTANAEGVASGTSATQAEAVAEIIGGVTPGWARGYTRPDCWRLSERENHVRPCRLLVRYRRGDCAGQS